MRQRHIKQLQVASEETPPCVWAITAQPTRLPKGWRRVAQLPDGCVYEHPDWGLAALRGITDRAGRRWMLLTAPCSSPGSLRHVQQLRSVFFRPEAIVALAVSEQPSDLVHLWWAVDREGLPMDQDWHEVVSEQEQTDP